METKDFKTECMKSNEADLENLTKFKELKLSQKAYGKGYIPYYLLGI